MTSQETSPRQLTADERKERYSDLNKVDDRAGILYFLKRFPRESPLNIVAITIIVGFFFLTILGPTLAPHDPLTPDTGNRFLSPSSQHWFGTDNLGRDVLSRVMTGARISLGIATLIISIAVVVGVTVGAIAGYIGGWVDEVIMRMTDIFLAFPWLILAMAIAAALGPSLQNTVIALAVVYWPWYARLVRGQVMAIKERDFVDAARSIGLRPSRILVKHILPNAWAPVIIQLTIDVGYAVLATAALSFIGLGAQPPSPEWGTMISGARTYFREAWWFITFPGIALSLTVIGFNLLGDGLRDYFDPRTRSR
jgi:peptide/nickel transport system permease protein